MATIHLHKVRACSALFHQQIYRVFYGVHGRQMQLVCGHACHLKPLLTHALDAPLHLFFFSGTTWMMGQIRQKTCLSSTWPAQTQGQGGPWPRTPCT